ncbi:hypothetical protein C8R44DRAFT_883836 [Mycena epipterygia]|nr:hypothetical protein C8R44DRAFT_883836 [Mycena epipterygia]
MSQPFNDYSAETSYSDSASWQSHQSMPYDYPAPYDMHSSGARPTTGESTSTAGFLDSATFSPSYDYADSPFFFDEFDSTPLSPSCSASSSSSSCSDAPITPYSHPVQLLYTSLDGPVGEEYCDSPAQAESTYGREWWEDEGATQTYRSVAMPESSLRSSAMHAEYDNPAALWACESAIAQLQYFDASPRSGLAPDRPTYASSDFPAVTSSAVSPLHTHSSLYPPVSCLSPSLLSCPPPLKLHQPQPRRSIPVVSLSALASGSENVPQSSAHVQQAPPALSPLELQFPSTQAQRVGMTSYSGVPYYSADSMVAYPLPCPCPECKPYSIS